MQWDAKSAIKNIALFANTSPSPVPGVGGPNKYTGKQFEYFEEPTSEYVWEYAQYASNYFKATVQGVIPGTFETERGAYIRSMDIVEQTTGAKMPNDYQTIYFQDTRIKGLYTGAKVKYAGNTWLAISPFNIADPMTQAVIRRCNAVWKHLDYYGNVLSEPFVFHDGRASATANEYLDWSVIPNWYQKCVMQLNDNTKELAYNRRIVLGSSVVEVRGLVDFVTDFSGDNTEGNLEPEPSHVMFFDVQYQQPTEIDDMERGIADGKAFSWVIKPSLANAVQIGTSQTISVTSLRNNEAPDTETYPVSYLFSSSDESVATVDANGVVTGVGEGTATITVTLEQNPDITAEVEIAVSSEDQAAEFNFAPELPAKLKQLQKYSGVVSVWKNGVQVDTPISVSAVGSTQSASVSFDGTNNSLLIESWEAASLPLSIVFTAEEYALTYTHAIRLEGF